MYTIFHAEANETYVIKVLLRHENKTESQANVSSSSFLSKQKVLRRAANRKEEVVLAAASILKATAGCRLIRCVRFDSEQAAAEEEAATQRGSRTGADPAVSASCFTLGTSPPSPPPPARCRQRCDNIYFLFCII